MLSHHPRLNPIVFREAELFTDRKVTDVILQGVAAMRGLPLLIEPGAVQTTTERAEAAEHELLRATADHRIVASLYAAARRRLGMANQRPAAERRTAQAAAMGALNKARAALRKADARLAPPPVPSLPLWPREDGHMAASSALDAALREIEATADLDPAKLDAMSPGCLRALLVGMIEQAREVRDGLLSGAAR